MIGTSSVTIHVPAALRQYCDGVSEFPVSASTVRSALAAIERSNPLLYRNLCDETGALRRHLNVFVNALHVREQNGLDTALSDGDVIIILTAVSGG